MWSKRFSLLFYLRKPKNNTRGKQLVYMRITIDAARLELSAQRECEPDRWNPRSGRARGTKEDVRELNAYLDSLQAKVYEAHRSLLDKNEPVTVESLRTKLRGAKTKARMILEVFQHHNDQVEQLLGKEFSAGTLERYKTSLDHTRSFLKWKYQVSDMDITELNYEFISEYSFWLKSIRNCSHNTTMKYLANFKKIVLICIKNGWLPSDPFTGFKLAKREVERPFLTQTELQEIASKRFPTDRLNYVRDIFLFSCFTGLAYADVRKLKRSEVASGVDGEQWIFTKRKKTDTSTRIPLLPTSLEILNQYADHPQCVNEDRILPVLSNQKMNAYLKEIADLCGINKNLTFHIARHTFATTVTLSNGVPIESVSKMLGHKNLKTTQHYAKILDRKVGEDMMALKERLALVNGKELI
jgi:site-specific recombinase XerD